MELLKVQRLEDNPEHITALDELLDHLPTWSELVDGLASGFERLLGIQLVDSVLTAEESSQVIRHSLRFSDSAWTWRL